MKDTNAVNSYAININKKKYFFTCPDGEDHVQELQDKLTAVIDFVSGQEPGHILSDYAMKVALLLADEVISGKKQRENQIREIEQKLALMIEELDSVLGAGS